MASTSVSGARYVRCLRFRAAPQAGQHTSAASSNSDIRSFRLLLMGNFSSLSHKITLFPAKSQIILRVFRLSIVTIVPIGTIRPFCVGLTRVLRELKCRGRELRVAGMALRACKGRLSGGQGRLCCLAERASLLQKDNLKNREMQPLRNKQHSASPKTLLIFWPKHY